MRHFAVDLKAPWTEESMKEEFPRSFRIVYSHMRSRMYVRVSKIPH